MRQPMTWDLEPIPYETNDPNGGMYLHLDKTGDTDVRAIYISYALATKEEVLEAIKIHGIEAFSEIAETSNEQEKLKHLLGK